MGPSHFLLQWVGISFHRSIGTLKQRFTAQSVLAASFCILEGAQSSLARVYSGLWHLSIACGQLHPGKS